MKITKRQLKRIIREEYTRLQRHGLLKEMGDYPEYGTGTSFGGLVTLEIDYTDMPMFDLAEFKSHCAEMGGCRVVKEIYGGEILHIEGPFQALWEGWVNCCDDEPTEFMARVIAGHENCPSM
tara:strand:- start:217 stop:582 length:366 start_codon:yes stop_codon:yes gene_type:complete